jgi:hypothetical protein
MVSHRQKHLLLNAEACARSERLPDCFLVVEARAAALRPARTTP